MVFLMVERAGRSLRFRMGEAALQDGGPQGERLNNFVTRLFGEAEMSEIAPDPQSRIDGARSFGWQSCAPGLPDPFAGTALFHTGWSGQTVLFDTSRDFFAVVLTTRCGDYDRAKRDRFAAAAALLP